MKKETYYFYKHYKLYQSVLNDIIMFSFIDYIENLYGNCYDLDSIYE